MSGSILIVDDEKPIVEILVYNLQKEGYNTLEANDGLTAVEIATTKKPDLILLKLLILQCKKLTPFFSFGVSFPIFC